MEEIKTIKVYDSHGKRLSNCTLKRAKELVYTNRGHWKDKGHTAVVIYLTNREKTLRNKRIIKYADGICYICGEQVPLDKATIDHVVPLSRKNKKCYRRDNLRCCCIRCNRDKNDMDILQYIQHIKDNRSDYDYISKHRLTILEEEFRKGE